MPLFLNIVAIGRAIKRARFAAMAARPCPGCDRPRL